MYIYIYTCVGLALVEPLSLPPSLYLCVFDCDVEVDRISKIACRTRDDRTNRASRRCASACASASARACSSACHSPDTRKRTAYSPRGSSSSSTTTNPVRRRLSRMSATRVVRVEPAEGGSLTRDLRAGSVCLSVCMSVRHATYCDVT